MRKGKGCGRSNGLLPNSLKIISSCLKTVSSNAGTVVRSAGASVAASIAVAPDDQKDQVLWAGFDKLELGPSVFRHVLLLGYNNGFQVIDVEDAANVCELVSKRDGPVTFLQMLPFPCSFEGHSSVIAPHPLLLVVAGDETNGSSLVEGGHLGAPIRDGCSEPQPGHSALIPTAVRFYSLKSDNYVHVLRFRSAVYMTRCSPQIIAVALAAQIYCIDAVTLETKFSVFTYPMPQGQGAVGVNIGYGPMAVGPRWLAYASNNPLLSNTGRLSPQNLTPSPGVSPSTSPSSGNLVARYAMESSKQLAAGIINLGDIGYKTLSKYCQDLLPDGSNSPVSTSSGLKVGRVSSASHPTDSDYAGTVVIKDFESKAIISQFRAHTSPISALCFDPTGTLVVTASVHGHNINVFRIMPSQLHNSSSSECYDWSSSHVHLYKLYRGLTAAVILDICFSHYSQWVAIVSSHGTCHIFVLSPFGGDVGLQLQKTHGDCPFLLPSLTLPWWSSSSCVINQQPRLPPSPVTLNVVSRIKNSNSGWLNTVSNAAASATGKVSVPSGAVAALFHNSIYKNIQSSRLKPNSLEHLLVYSPSGHVIQHELQPALGVESYDGSIANGFGSSAPIQDEELRVRAEPVQWWDVCRRSNWPEREENFSLITTDKSEIAELVMDASECEDNGIMYLKSLSSSLTGRDQGKSNERSHLYLSNAEVQVNSGRIPLWQRAKVFFSVVTPMVKESAAIMGVCVGGEIEIEKIPVHEVEIRRKDLLPVFEHYHGIRSGWNDRGRGLSLSSEVHSTKDKFMEEAQSKYAARGSIESSVLGQAALCGQTTYLNKEFSTEERGGSLSSPPPESHARAGVHLHSGYAIQDSARFLPRLTNNNDGCTIHSSPSLKGNSLPTGQPILNGAQSFCNSLGSDMSKESSVPSHSALVPNVHMPSEHADSNNPQDFAQYFHEGYCKISELDDCRELAEVVNDEDSSSSHCEREKPEDDGDNDDMLGGVFSFCEEG